MEHIMDAAAEERLRQYIDGLGEILGHPQRREAFALYTLGLFSGLERKSVEPVASPNHTGGRSEDLMSWTRIHIPISTWVELGGGQVTE
ncbi:hypothetical protein [Sorangium sp. So ce204]|uniref:hypothetical protein n=1 Tax=Sorangium sp. So ce204 TaxID=3133288 RepID=UPI003F639A95